MYKIGEIKILNFERSPVAAILNRETNSNDVILNQKNDVCHFVTDNPRKPKPVLAGGTECPRE